MTMVIPLSYQFFNIECAAIGFIFQLNEKRALMSFENSSPQSFSVSLVVLKIDKTKQFPN